MKFMAEAFIPIIVAHVILAVVKWLHFDFYQERWRDITNAVYLEPVVLSLLIFGVILLVNEACRQMQCNAANRQRD